jgi:hypothetical protein
MNRAADAISECIKTNSNEKTVDNTMDRKINGEFKH